MNIFTASEVRGWDAYTIEHAPIASIDLMERAATRCAEWMMANISNTNYHVYCGKGNNGGDGLAIARHLLAEGSKVEVFMIDAAGEGTEDFQQNLQRLRTYTNAIHFISEEQQLSVIDASTIVVDALFGSGLNRSLDGIVKRIIEHINSSGAKVISIDIPSGMYADRSSVGNVMVKATHTLTFQCMKPCFLAAENADAVGQLTILDIGLHADYPATIQQKFHCTDLRAAAGLMRPRNPFSHKGTHGHGLVVGGEKGKAGAAIMAAEGCLRTGAGLTSLYLMGGDHTAANIRCPEVMTIAADLMTKQQIGRYDAIAIGPGMGSGDIARHLVELVAGNANGRIVADADALNVLSTINDWDSMLPAGSILTPHPKEFDRLFGAHSSWFDQVDTALRVSAERRLVVVLKGRYTLVAAGGTGYFNTSGNAGLAKGGSGDVLTGMIGGLLAQRLEPLDAARLGVFLHGLCADLALETQSLQSMVATDLLQNTGKTFKMLSSVS